MGTLVRLYYLAALALFATGFCPTALPHRDVPAVHAVQAGVVALAPATCPCQAERPLPLATAEAAPFTAAPPPFLPTRARHAARPRAPPTRA